MRDHRSLRAFQLADGLVMETYRLTRSFPRHELFGLTGQMRRAAISAASNIVEGCARDSQKDFARLLDVALGSVKELSYQLSIAKRLGYGSESLERCEKLCEETAKVITGLRQVVQGRKEAVRS